jgi:hypothetical protein
MKKTFTLLMAALLLTTALQAQEEEKEAPKRGFQREKLFLGGNFGLAFGDYTLINVSPQLGYRFTNFFAAGLGINGQYVSIKERSYNGDLIRKSTRGVAGLNAFGRVYPVSFIMLQVQPEANYIFGKDRYYNADPSQTLADAVIAPSLLLGGGAVIPSGRGAMIISVFYDVLQDENSPYGRRPIYNIGYNIGF